MNPRTRLLTPLLLAAGFVAFALMGGATAQDKDDDACGEQEGRE